MRIRDVREEDAPRAAALWTEAYTLQNPDEGRKLPYPDDELCTAAATGRILVTESEDGEVVGIVSLVASTSWRGAVARAGEAELARLAIARAARGRGVGRALAVHCLELAAKKERRRSSSGAAPTRPRHTPSTNRSAFVANRSATARTPTAAAGSSR